MTLYDVLQITESASPEIVRAAYLALAKKYHPDLYKDNPVEAAERMKTINAAYSILSDSNKRNQYDLYLRTQRSQSPKNTPQTQTTQHTRPKPSAGPAPCPPKQEHHPRANGKKSLLDRAYILSWIVIFFVVVLPLLIGAYSLFIPDTSTPHETAPALQPISEPATGTLLSGYEPYNSSEITVTASHGSSCLVKLKDVYKDDVLSFYVRAGETVTINVPQNKMYVYFASGDTWYGIEHLFGEDTYYSKDDTLLDFANYTWEYTLYPVTNGNFSQTPINADEFN